jgi:hypothetical protein
MKDPIKLKDLILETVDFGKVMMEYKVQFGFNPLVSDEVQFRCPFHGDDSKPSSRYYRSTQSTYCWVCKERLNVISFIMKKQSLNFIGALNHIVNRYGIDTNLIPDTVEFATDNPKAISRTNIEMSYIKRKLFELRRTIPFEKYNILCAAYYMVLFMISKGDDVTDKVSKLEMKLL